MLRIPAKDHPLIAAELKRFPYAKEVFEDIEIMVSDSGEIMKFYSPVNIDYKYVELYGKKPSLIKCLATIVSAIANGDSERLPAYAHYGVCYFCNYKIPTDFSIWFAFAAAVSYTKIPDVFSYEARNIEKPIGTVEDLTKYLWQESIAPEDVDYIYDIMESRSGDNKILAMLRTEKYIPSRLAIAMYIYADFTPTSFWESFAKACYKL
jgi:hypothetical protein